MVETESDAILVNADVEDIAMLVVGDPFGCVPADYHRYRAYKLSEQQHMRIFF